MHKDAHLIFLKYPEEGKVKTRLGRDIGYAKAAEIYKTLAEELVRKSDTSHYDIVMFIEPYEKLTEFEDWLGRSKYFPQEGGDLGERMFNAIKKAFDSGYERCVLTGSDIPALDSVIIKNSLRNMQDAVIGKASDGGYYLIGFKKETLTDKVFSGIEWSTATVYYETMKIFDSLGYDMAQAPILSDLDTREDLRHFRGWLDEI